jgi:hypothetical protein
VSSPLLLHYFYTTSPLLLHYFATTFTLLLRYFRTTSKLLLLPLYCFPNYTTPLIPNAPSPSSRSPPQKVFLYLPTTSFNPSFSFSTIYLPIVYRLDLYSFSASRKHLRVWLNRYLPTQPNHARGKVTLIKISSKYTQPNWKEVNLSLAFG